ncbi:MAG TPA: ABC transporter permease [Candidatus Koribacter sp.]|jgi:predicted permease
MLTLLQDIRFAARQLRKNPGFTITTMLTLALGIGTTTAIFSLVNAVLLRPLPFPQPDRLVYAADSRAPRQGRGANSGAAPESYPDFFDLRQQNHSLEYLAAFHDDQFTLNGQGDAKHLTGSIVSADFFRVLGIHPQYGRDFLPEDEKAGVHVVMLSHSLWQSSFGSNPDIVGKTISLGGTGYVVAGVMPKDFSFPVHVPAPQIWTSTADDAYAGDGDKPLTIQRGAHFLEMVGRLKHGVSPDQAQADLAVIVRNLSQQYPDTNKRNTGAEVAPELEHLVGNTRPALRVLFCAVFFVLLIACVNVAGLLLARASKRRPEIAVRAALGASRLQLLRQILVESLFIGLCGGIAGVALSVLLLKLAMRFVPEHLPRLDQVTTDSRVLAFAIVLSLLTGIVFGILPALRISKMDPSTSLREGTRTSSGGRHQHHVHGALVIIETAVGLLLLVGSGLLIRSFTRIMHVDPGFDSHHVLVASIDLPGNRYTNEKNVRFYNQLLPRIAAIPGVQSVSAGWPLPFAEGMMTITFQIEGRPLPQSELPSEVVSEATPGFFKTLGIPVKLGREFTEADTRDSTNVVVVTESFARKYFPNENPIGKRIKPGVGDGTTNDVFREIVGVVGDIKRGDLTSDARPEYYVPHTQATLSSPTLVLRASGDPTAVAGAIRGEVAALDKTVPVYDVHRFDDMVENSVAQPRFQSILLTFFATIALLLSAVGLYGVLSYMVAQRTLEIGVRMALGARRTDVLQLVLRRGLSLALLGLVIGVLLSVALTRYMASMLYSIKPLDPVTMLSVTAILLLVSLLASTAPAWRAARLDPMKTLRDQ